MIVVDSRFLGFIAAFLSALMYSLASIFYRSVLTERDPLLVTLIRVLPATIFVLTILPIFGDVNELFNGNIFTYGYAFFAGAVGMVLGAYFYMVSLKYVGVSIGYPISFSYPIFVALLASLFLNEHITFIAILALTLTIGGITVISKSNKNNGSEKHLIRGVLAALTASIIWATSIVVVKIALGNSSALGFAALRLIAASLVSLPVIIYRINELKQYKLDEVAKVSLGGVLGIGLGIVFAHISIELIGASLSSIVSASSPGLSILLAYLLLGEKLDKVNGVGVLMVLLGTILVVI